LELLDYVKLHVVLYIDETGHKRDGKKYYMWIFVCNDATVFKIGTRSTHMLDSVLGSEFVGTIVSDHYGAYNCYAKKNENADQQYCVAHLMRDVKNCEDHGNQEVRRYGKALREKVSFLIDVYKAYSQAEGREAEKLLGRLLELKQEIIAVATTDVPQVPSKASGISKRFLDHPESYFTFFVKDGVEITNNNAERGLRPLVLQRLINQQTRSLDGDMEIETFTSINSTLKKNKQDPLKFMVDALKAYSEGRPLPSLVNIGQTVDPKYVEMAKQERKDIEKRKAEEKEKTSKESDAEQNPVTPKKAKKQSKEAKEPEVEQSPVAPEETVDKAKGPETKEDPGAPEETVDKAKGPETKEDPGAPEETVDKAKGPETKEDPVTPVETEAKDKEPETKEDPVAPEETVNKAKAPETKEDPVTPVKTEAKDKGPETKHQSAITKEAEAKEPQSKQSPDIPKKTEDRSKIPKETKSK
jgi:transposase